MSNCHNEEHLTEPLVAFDIIGTWEVAKIGSSSDVDGSNSTWTFDPDGSYAWFLRYAGFNYRGGGIYTLDGTSLTVTGIVSELYGQESIKLSLSITDNDNAFSLRDPDGDYWTYNRILTVTDSDGNVYKAIKIENQWWMAENLRVTHYRNGDVISDNRIDNSTWVELTKGA